MSVSREEKQQKAAQEAAQAKRKTTIYIIIGVVCAVLAAALLIWNSGFFQSRAVAYSVGDTDFTVAEYEYFYYDIYNQYANYGLVDTSTPANELVYNEETGETYHDFFCDYTEGMLQSFAMLYNGAVEAGMSLTADEKAALKDNLNAYGTYAAQYGYTTDSYLKAMFGSYMTKDLLLDITGRQTLASNFYDEKLASFTYGDDELDAYYDENSGTLDTFVQSTCFISSEAQFYDTEDADEAKTLAKEVADKMADDLTAGGDFQTLAEAATEGQTNPTIYVGMAVPGSQLSSLYGDWLRDTARKAGDVTVMESTGGNGYFVVQFLDRYLLTDDTADIRHILIKAETDEGADAPTADQLAASKAEIEALLSTWEGGERTEDSFAALATEKSEDTGSNTNGGFYNTYRGQMIPSFDSWVFDSARKTGDTGIVENDNSGTEGYHLIYYVGANEPYWKQQATAALQDSDINSWMDGLIDAVECTRGSGFSYVG